MIGIPDMQRTSGTQGLTKVVMLGTGTPRPDPNRSGPATAIVVDDTPYLIDFGPGVIRRATAAYENGVLSISVPKPEQPKPKRIVISGDTAPSKTIDAKEPEHAAV